MSTTTDASALPLGPEQLRHADSLATVPPLNDAQETIGLLARASGRAPAAVEALLRKEYDDPGSVVRCDLAARGIEPHAWSEGMQRFYSESDAFLFELAVWNNDLAKRRLRRWIAMYLARRGTAMRVLMIGDGIGVDGVHLAACGHRVEALELPGPTLDACRLVHRHCGVDIPLHESPATVPEASFDAIACLDVLEHVPKPRSLLDDLRTRLAPGGVIIASSPFHLVDRRAVTHLRENLRYSGRLSLYEKAGFCLIDGTRWWAPLVLARCDDDAAPPASPAALRQVRLGGFALSTARWWSWPARTITPGRSRTRRWFGPDPA